MSFTTSGFESGWHRIAWAFLKPCGPNNILNIDKRLRLQLYKPRHDKPYQGHSVCEKCDVSFKADYLLFPHFGSTVSLILLVF